jgi:hypothetical protein
VVALHVKYLDRCVAGDLYCDVRTVRDVVHQVVPRSDLYERSVNQGGSKA